MKIIYLELLRTLTAAKLLLFNQMAKFFNRKIMPDDKCFDYLRHELQNTSTNDHKSFF